MRDSREAFEEDIIRERRNTGGGGGGGGGGIGVRLGVVGLVGIGETIFHEP